MTDDFLKSNFGGNTSLSQEIQAFVEMLVDRKMLQFELAEISSRFPKITTAGLIIKASHFSSGLDGTYINDPQIMYAFYHHFSHIFGYTLTADGADIQDFAHKIGDYFHAQASQGVSGLVNALVRFLLHSARQGYGLDISSYALTLQRLTNQERFFEFFNAYFEVILQADGSFESVWEVCRHFAIQVGPPKVNDMTWRKFGLFVNTLVDHHRERLTDIRAIAEKEQTDPALKALYLELLLKICREGALSVGEIINWLDEKNTQEKAINLLFIQQITDTELRQRLLDRLMSLPGTAEQKTQRLHVYLKMLEDSNVDDAAFKTKLLTVIADYFDDPDVDDLSVPLRLLGRCMAEPDARYGILLKVLKGQQFKPEYLASCMDIFFITHPDVTLFFHFMKTACLQVGSAQEVMKALDSPIHMYRGEMLEDFEREAVLLCVDSEGICRLLGQELLLSEFSLNQPASLTYDVLRLDILQQYKFVLSLLHQLRPINHTIPAVIRLLDSSSEIVRELIVCKLEELIPAYQYGVIEQVKSALPDAQPQKTALLARLETSWSELAEVLHKKRAIKEFNPQLSETEQMRAYQRAATKASKEAAKKVRKEHKGISSLFKITQVARGGGTVMRDGSVQQMMSQSISYTLPRTMFITPERNDYEMQLMYSSNWDKDFEQWEQTILSSGSI